MSSWDLTSSSVFTPLFKKTEKDIVYCRSNGWAQVNGKFFNLGEKFELDLWYVENKSVWLDFYILILTLKKLFPGHLTEVRPMPKF